MPDSQKISEKQSEYMNLIAEIMDIRKRGEKPVAYIRTYGCQQNFADGEKLEGMLLEMGYSLADKMEDAEFVIFNTCAIRENAEILYTAQFPISDEGLEQLRTWLLEHAAAVNAANPESFRYAW